MLLLDLGKDFAQLRKCHLTLSKYFLEDFAAIATAVDENVCEEPDKFEV